MCRYFINAEFYMCISHKRHTRQYFDVGRDVQANQIIEKIASIRNVDYSREGRSQNIDGQTATLGAILKILSHPTMHILRCVDE